MERVARLAELKEGAGKLWWESYLEQTWTEVNRRFQEGKSVYWHPAEAMPMELFAYLREAHLCFSVGRFLATISLSGALVEVILNKDSRVSSQPSLKQIDGWTLLNNNNLAIAKSVGVPVDELIDAGENIHDRTPIRFVRLRNKVAHGDLKDYPVDLPERNPEYEREARDQLLKSARFLVAWYNASPDIQSP